MLLARDEKLTVLNVVADAEDFIRVVVGEVHGEGDVCRLSLGRDPFVIILQNNSVGLETTATSESVEYLCFVVNKHYQCLSLLEKNSSER